MKYDNNRSQGVRKMDKKIGKVTHYYNKIGVAVIQVTGSLKIGDKIKIVGHDNEFSQEITSMQTEHQQIQKAKKGDDIGMKVDRPVKENDQVYLVK